MVRTISSYERAGVAGVHVEDQVLPKKCGHMEDKAVVDRDEFRGKVAAAAAARTDTDFVLAARTDARAPHGLDEAIARGELAVEAGADVLFIEALENRDEIEQVAARFAGTPLVFNWVEGGKTPPLTYREIGELGFAMILMPIGTLLAATAAMQSFLRRLKDDGTPAGFADELLPFGDFTDLIGLGEIGDLERRFGSDHDSARPESSADDPNS